MIEGYNPTPTPSPVCKGSDFSCGDGQCIPDALVCDKRYDCRNGRDEENCMCK